MPGERRENGEYVMRVGDDADDAGAKILTYRSTP
jgi:hypothetical protein